MYKKYEPFVKRWKSTKKIYLKTWHVRYTEMEHAPKFTTKPCCRRRRRYTQKKKQILRYTNTQMAPGNWPNAIFFLLKNLSWLLSAFDLYGIFYLKFHLRCDATKQKHSPNNHKNDPFNCECWSILSGNWKCWCVGSRVSTSFLHRQQTTNCEWVKHGNEESTTWKLHWNLINVYPS